ncbi:MAG: cysteine hydrolase [Firmicutes bacterium]|nr:cysteine hydrolase [Bacillota bacterium]
MHTHNESGSMPTRSALIVIDMQRGCLNPSGGLPEQENFMEVAKNIKQIIAFSRQKGIPVIHTREVHRYSLIDFGRETDGSEGIHFLDSTEDALYIEGFEPAKEDYEIVKRRYSAFYCTDLDILLSALKVDTLFLVGELTNVCVHYTFVDGHQRDYYMKVIKECVVGSDDRAHEAALEQMSYLQKNAVISTAQYCEIFDGQ